MELVSQDNSFTAGTTEFILEALSLKSVLNVRYQSVLVGQLMKDKLVPDHALALSKLENDQIPALDLDYDQAIKFLQKHDLNLAAGHKGWTLVRYRGNNLGWINVLTNRINNYYPKELRILKRSKDDSFEK